MGRPPERVLLPEGFEVEPSRDVNVSQGERESEVDCGDNEDSVSGGTLWSCTRSGSSDGDGKAMATLPSSRSNSMTRVRPSRLTEMEGESGGTGGDDDWMTALLPDRWRHVVGITLVALSAFVFSVMSLLVKVVGSSLSSFNLVFIRAMVQLVLAIFYLWYHAISPYKAEWPLKRKIVLVMRGVFGISGVSAIYFAMQYLPLGDSQALFFSSAVFAGVAARIVLGERFTALDLAISLVAMVGVVCVAQPVAIS